MTDRTSEPSPLATLVAMLVEIRPALEHAQQLLDTRTLTQLDDFIDDPKCEWEESDCQDRANYLAVCYGCREADVYVCQPHKSAYSNYGLVICRKCHRSGAGFRVFKWMPIFTGRSKR